MSDPLSDLNFTDAEKLGVERHWGQKWDDLTDAGKLLRGIAYRYTLSPKAIAESIVGPETPAGKKVREEMAAERKAGFRHDQNGKVIITDDDGNDIGAQG